MFILFTLISIDFGAPIQEFMLHSMQSYCDVVNTELQCQYSGPGLYILDNTHVDILSMDRFFQTISPNVNRRNKSLHKGWRERLGLQKYYWSFFNYN